MRYLYWVLLLGLTVCHPIPVPAGPPPVAPVESPKPSPQSIGAATDHGHGTSQWLPWQQTALWSCERHGCDGRLLIAIGLVETGTDPRGAKAAHTDKVSYGRYGMQTTTAAYHLMGVKYSNVKHLLTDDVAYIVNLLGQEAIGADVAARHLRWCQDRPWVRTSRYPRANAAYCWNPGDRTYPGKVVAEYRKLTETKP